MTPASPRIDASLSFFSRFRSRLESYWRKAGIVDTLVFMIAGFLLPAWLLGHLFLTFYPAPDRSHLVSDGDSKLAIASGPSDASGLDLPKVNLANKDTEKIGAENGASPGAELTSALQGKYDSLTVQFESLKRKSADFESQLASHEAANAELQQENAALKTMAAEMPPSDASSDTVSSLEQQFNAATAKLSTTQQSLANAETKLQSTEALVQTLRANLESTQSKLAAAEQRASQMTSPSKPSAGSQVGEIPTEYSAADDAGDGKIAMLEQQISKLNQQIESAGTTLKTTTQALADREKDLQLANDVVQDLKAQNNELKIAFAAAQQRTRQAEPPQEAYRDFVSSKGSVAKMAFVRWEGDQVIVRSFVDKKLHRLSLDRFAAADQAYLLKRK